jgi:hypothetical protein
MYPSNPWHFHSDKNALELDRGGGSTTLWMYQMPQTLNLKMVNFTFCKFLLKVIWKRKKSSDTPKTHKEDMEGRRYCHLCGCVGGVGSHGLWSEDFQILCVQHGDIQARQVDEGREAIELIKGKGKALQKQWWCHLARWSRWDGSKEKGAESVLSLHQQTGGEGTGWFPIGWAGVIDRCSVKHSSQLLGTLIKCMRW